MFLRQGDEISGRYTEYSGTFIFNRLEGYTDIKGRDSQDV